MKTFPHGFSPERRRLLAGAAGLAVLAAVPVTGLSAFADKNPGKPRAWLGRFDEQRGHWQPAGNEAVEDVQSERPLKLVVRGPWPLAGTAPPALTLGVVYRNLPSQPFLLPDDERSGGVVLHASSSALAGLHVCRRGEPSELGTLCPLGCDAFPSLSPGRYALLIDDADTLHSPDWSALAHPGNGTKPLRYEGHPAPRAALSVHIVPLSPQN